MFQWHTVVGDPKAKYHRVNETPTGDWPWLRLSRIRDDETSEHRFSGAPSVDDLFGMSQVKGGEDCEFYGSNRRRLWLKRGNEYKNRKRSDGMVRLDVVRSDGGRS